MRFKAPKGGDEAIVRKPQERGESCLKDCDLAYFIRVMVPRLVSVCVLRKSGYSYSMV